MKPRYIAWYGGVRPVKGRVEMVIRNGARMIGRACAFSWSRLNQESDIIAYRVIEQE
jgi:hypothetical protein